MIPVVGEGEARKHAQTGEGEDQVLEMTVSRPGIVNRFGVQNLNTCIPGMRRGHVHRDLNTELEAFRSTRLTPVLSPAYRWGG